MRIVINGMLLHRCQSGVEFSIADLARGLAKRGAEEYVFLVPAGSPAKGIQGERFATRTVEIPGHWRLFRILWEQAILPGRIAREKADILHAPAYVAPLRARMPVMLTVYDLIALRFPGYCKSSNAAHYRALVPLSVRKAAGIIVPSAATRDDLVSLWPSAADKTRVIPLGVREEFRPTEDTARVQAVRSRYGLPDEYILFVGRIEPKKNVPGLLKAYWLLRASGGTTCGLVLAGPKDWGYAEADRTARELGLAGEIHFLDWVPPEDLVCLYGGARLLMFPSLYEGFGIPPLEAMACGTPVIVSDRGALPEVTGDAAMRVDPTRADSMAGAMKELLGNAVLREEMIAKGRKRASEFRWERTAEETERFYREIGGRSGRRNRGEITA